MFINNSRLTNYHREPPLDVYRCLIPDIRLIYIQLIMYFVPCVLNIPPGTV